MKSKFAMASLVLLSLLTACQKEFSIDDPNSSTAGAQNGSSTSGNTNGDLVVRGLNIFAATKDTTFVYFTWDGNKKLSKYTVKGSSNGIPLNSELSFQRDPSGKAVKIIELPPTSSTSFTDSVVSLLFYNGNQIAYTKTTTYSSFMNIEDSIVFTYNAAGKVSQTLVFATNIFSSTLQTSSKNLYTYDQAGNLTKLQEFIADPLTGSIPSAATQVTDFTYNTHKTVIQLGDEAYIIQVMGPETTAPNTMTKKVKLSSTNGVTQTITGDISNMTYNTFDRPVTADLTVRGVIPSQGYDLTTKSKGYYFYQ